MSISYKPMDGPYAEKIDKCFGVENSLIEANPGKVLMPPQFMEIGERIMNSSVREDDVWLLSYPRTGSTWTQEMVWLIGNDFDFEGAKQRMQLVRTPLIELSAVLVRPEYKGFMESYGNSVEVVEKTPSPRFIKSHLPIDLLPTDLMKVKPKIVYVARNPKDMCVSYFHHIKSVHNMTVTFEEFCDFFLNDKLPIGPIWNHYLGFWNIRNESNVLFIKFEELKKDLRGIIQKTADFLNKTVTEKQIDSLCEYLSFENMKNNKSVNFGSVIAQSNEGNEMEAEGIIRKGEIGDWKNYMTPELSKRFDDWIEKNTKGTGLSFNV